MNCPICNKSGLPDFTINPVICPQCNSDLKGFALLEKTNTIHKETVRKQRHLYSLLLVLIILGFSFIVFLPSETTNDLQPVVQNNDSIIKILKTELKVKELEIIKLQSLVVDIKETKFLYVVKRGDNLSKIAYFFYSDWEMYKKIEEDNNLDPGSILLPKDTLLIKLKSK